MATKAGTAYVEVKYDPDSIRRLRADTLAEGEKISKAWKGADKGLIDFDRAAAKVNKTMSGGPFGLFDALGNVGYAFLKMNSFAQKAGDQLGNLFKSVTTGEAGLTSLGSALGSLTPLFGLAAAGAVSFGAALLVLPALAAAATFALVTLLDVATTAAAGIAALAGPLTVVIGLLGGLGAAFAYVAAQSFKNQATSKQVHDNLLALHVAQQTYNEDLAKYGKNATQTERALLALHKAQETYDQAQQGVALHISEIQDKFASLVKTLSADFRPELIKLADAASTALTYLGRIAKLPLKQAFQSLSTEGVALLSKFAYGIGNVLKRPFRLAIQLAFGSGGANAQTAITNWWNSLTGYLFGYSQRHPIKLGDHIIGFTTRQVDGALKPILDWFNRQHFTRTAIKWSNEIINGFTQSGGKARIAQWAGEIFAHAGHEAGKAFSATFEAELHKLPGWVKRVVWHEIQTNAFISASAQARFITSHLGAAWDRVRAIAGRAWDWIKNKASGALHAIASAISSILGNAWGAVKNAASNAWEWIKSKAIRAWNTIKSFVESALTVHINWPSVPGPIQKIFDAGGSIVSGAKSLVTPATGGLITGGIPGRDSVPALLTPGELVLNKQQQLSLLRGGVGGGEPMAFNFYLDGKLIDVRVEAANRQTARRVKAGRKWEA